MLKLVKERILHWDKIAKPRQKLDVKCFCLWLGKTEEQIISEYYSIEKPQLLTRWKRDYGSLIRKWYEALMQGTKVYITEEKTKMQKVKKLKIETRKYKHNSARNMAFNVALWLRETCDKVIFDKKIPPPVETTKEEHEFIVEQLKRMFVVGDVEERAILQLAVNIGFRIEDFIKLKREPFARAVKQVRKGKPTPIEIKVFTGKRKRVAYSQVTKNTIDTLHTYLKTKKTTEYLFTKNGKSQPKTERQLNYMLKHLWKRAYPDAKEEASKIGFHLLRKYLYTMMFKVKVDAIARDLVIGKKTDTSKTTYIQSGGKQLGEHFLPVLPYVELGEFIAVQPRNLEQQRQREIQLTQALKWALDKIEELTGERPTISIPVKEELPTPEELADLFNGNNNKESKTKWQKEK